MARISKLRGLLTHYSFLMLGTCISTSTQLALIIVWPLKCRDAGGWGGGKHSGCVM